MITTTTYTGINGNRFSVDFDEDMIYVGDTDELKPGAKDKEAIISCAFSAFGRGDDDAAIRAHYGELEPYSLSYLMDTVHTLRACGGIWIGYDMALIEGRGVVIANSDSDPDLRDLWRAEHKNDEIICD